MENIMIPRPHKIMEILKETQAEYTFRVEYDGQTQNGQFFQLSIPKVGEAPISVSGRGEGYVEFTIRKTGRLTEGVFGLDKGDTLFMRGPYGNAFPVDKFEGKNLVFISGGTGLAPIKTTINYFYDNPDKHKEVYIISGFKDINAVLFTDELKKFEKEFHTTWCLDDSDEPGFKKGLVTKFIPDIPFKDFDDVAVIIVGPPPMMKFSAAECLNQGVKEDDIWVSYERRMSCAVGKCGHCKINGVYVCLEGPVFNYSFAKDLMD